MNTKPQKKLTICKYEHILVLNMSTMINSQTSARRSDQVVSKLVDRMMTRFQSAPEETIDACLYKTSHRERLTKIIGQNYPDVRGIVGSLAEYYLEFVQIEQNDAEWGDVDVSMAWAGHAVELENFFEEIIPEVEAEVPAVTPIVVPPTTLDLKLLEKDLTELQNSNSNSKAYEKIWETLDKLSRDLNAVDTAKEFFLRYICTPIHEWECYNRKCIFKIYLKDLTDLCKEMEFEGFDLTDLQRKISEAKLEQLHPMAMGYGSMVLNDCQYDRKGDHKSILEITKVKVRPGYTRLQAELVLPEYLMDHFIKKYANGQEYLLFKRRVTRPDGGEKVSYSWDQIEHV